MKSQSAINFKSTQVGQAFMGMIERPGLVTLIWPPVLRREGSLIRQNTPTLPGKEYITAAEMKNMDNIENL